MLLHKVPHQVGGDVDLEPVIGERVMTQKRPTVVHLSDEHGLIEMHHAPVLESEQAQIIGWMEVVVQNRQRSLRSRRQKPAATRS